MGPLPYTLAGYYYGGCSAFDIEPVAYTVEYIVQPLGVCTIELGMCNL